MYRALASMGPGNKQTTTTAGGGSSSSGATAGGGAIGFTRPDDAPINSFCTRVNQAAQKFDKVWAAAGGGGGQGGIVCTMGCLQGKAKYGKATRCMWWLDVTLTILPRC